MRPSKDWKSGPNRPKKSSMGKWSDDMAKTTPEIIRLKKTADRARANLDRAKLYQKHGLELPPTKRQMNAESRRMARALPKEKRQEVLDAFRQGGRTMKEIASECGVSIEEIIGVILINTKTVKHMILNVETV